MAKTSIIARENKRTKLTKRFQNRVSSLKEQLKAAYHSDDDAVLAKAEDAQAKLQKIKKNGLPVRGRTRCRLCGRPRAVYRRFGLCRIHLREALMRGDVTGATKSSW